MASLKAIRKRILSVQSTQQITKAMKMVAAARLRRAQEAALTARGYSRRLAELAAVLSCQDGVGEHPLLAAPDKDAPVCMIVISSDRGLCGGYNSNLCRRVTLFLEQRQVKQVKLLVVGRKGAEYFNRRGGHLLATYSSRAAAGLDALAREVNAAAQGRYLDGQVGEVYLAYNQFRSALSQVPVVERVMPIELSVGEAAAEYLLEPDPQQLLSMLLPRLVEVKIRQALLEGVASEHGARMTAMDSATNNAGEMIERLTLVMNRARQAIITKELMEIVSGAEALKG